MVRYIPFLELIQVHQNKLSLLLFPSNLDDQDPLALVMLEKAFELSKNIFIIMKIQSFVRCLHRCLRVYIHTAQMLGIYEPLTNMSLNSFNLVSHTQFAKLFKLLHRQTFPQYNLS